MCPGWACCGWGTRSWARSCVCSRPAGTSNSLEHTKSSLLSLGTPSRFYGKVLSQLLVLSPCFLKVFQEFDWDKKENSGVSSRVSKWMNLILRIHRLVRFQSCAICWCRFSRLFMKGGETLWVGVGRRNLGKVLYFIRKQHIRISKCLQYRDWLEMWPQNEDPGFALFFPPLLARVALENWTSVTGFTALSCKLLYCTKDPTVIYSLRILYIHTYITF